MAESGGRLANLFLRYAVPFSGLRRLPLVGDFLSWTSRRLVPSGTLIWVQIESGSAAGLWIRVNPRTGQSVRAGLGEPIVQQALVDHLRPGMTFYDLGANIGFFSLLAARLVGPGGRVVSFEADPEIAARLQENLTRNAFHHVTVEQKAVWSENTHVSFERVDTSQSPDRGLGHVASSSSAGSTPSAIQVEAVALDQFVTDHPTPDFIKCDVEGAETAVFQGARQLLSTRRPILLVEMHSETNHQALSALFRDLRYNIRNLDETHVLALPAAVGL